jgi:hypothetical protein
MTTNTTDKIPAAGKSTSRHIWRQLRPRLALGGLTTVALIGLTLLLVQERPAAADDGPIQWASAEVLEFVQPDQTNDVRVTFKSSKAFGATAVRLTPSLTPYVAVTPSRFDRIVANQIYAVTLRIKSGARSEFKVDGALQLRASSTSALSQPLPMAVVVHSELVPPDPGNGRQTLSGTDSDGDGVRDDFQRFIIATYIGSAPEIAAGLQFGRAAQTVLLASDQAEASIGAARQLLRAVDCLSYVQGVERATSTYNTLRAELLDTVLRSRSWLKASRQFSGQSYRLGPIEARHQQCDANPSAP